MRLLRRKTTLERLLRWKAPLKGLLGIGTGWQILVLMNALCHALKHVGRNLAHLAHVGFLLHALLLTGDRVKRSLLLGKRRNVLSRRGCKSAGDRRVLPRTAFRAEHAVCWN